MSDKQVLLYSGGMDSLIAWHNLNIAHNETTDTLYVDLDHRYVHDELVVIDALPPRPRVVNVNYGRTFEEPDAHIPGRNFLLAMCAANLGYDVIWLVAQAGEQTVPDRTPDFFTQGSKMLSILYDRPITVNNVFPMQYKDAIVRWYVEEDLPVYHLLIARSCYTSIIHKYPDVQPGYKHECGQCAACFRKFASLEYNGIDSRVCFRNDIQKWGREHYLPRVDQYDFHRAKVIRVACGEV